MDARRSQISTGLLLLIGVAFGWILASSRPAPVRASAGDRSGGYILATGPVMMGVDNITKTQVPVDAVYFLDHRGGRLLGTVPTYRQTGGKTQLIEGFAERDLVADFKLDVQGGPEPRFLMTTGSLGQYSMGWAPLYVFEATSGQVGVYRIQASSTIGKATQPRFELLELYTYPKTGALDSNP
ncbi:MAG: hypothetical protein ACLQGP_35745 [Isosphaeraceae bacterium]